MKTDQEQVNSYPWPKKVQSKNGNKKEKSELGSIRKNQLRPLKNINCINRNTNPLYRFYVSDSFTLKMKQYRPSPFTKCNPQRTNAPKITKNRPCLDSSYQYPV